MLKYIKNKILNNLRYTKLHYFYLKYKNPDYINDLNKEANFYQDILNKNDLVFDLGANLGEKTEIFQRFVKKIICYEPNEYLCKRMISRFRNNKSIVIIQVVVSDTENVVDFTLVKDNEAYSTMLPNGLIHFKHLDKTKFYQKKIKSTTLTSEIKKFGIPDYIKIDCEGAEYLILKDLKNSIKLISFEVNLPQYKIEGIKIVNSLSSKFDYEFNVRLQDKHGFYYSKNTTSKELILFMGDQTISIEIFAFLKNN
jgi:FkbM family methyltransferase